MEKLILLITAILLGLTSVVYNGGSQQSQKVIFKDKIEPIKNVTIIVTYDNNPYDSRLRTAWGFSCLIRLEEKTILFDTGGDSSTLLNNMEQLKIDPREVDMVILSHIHGDHVGGLPGFLKRNSNVIVYVPKSFPQSFKNEIKSYGAKYEEVDEGKKLFDNVYTTGQLGTSLKEQSLILNTSKGLIVITGCAHPGIVEIVKKSKQLVGRTPLLVMGGFHLGGTSDREIKKIIADFKKLGVMQVGACHCSGDRARHLFHQAYGENFLNVGVGKVINIQMNEERRN